VGPEILVIVIGHGPETPGKITGVILVVLGIFFAVLSLHPGTTIGAGFSHGRGPRSPISIVGRITLFVVALVLTVTGLRGFIN
jgi:hypothetical protein